MSSPSQGGVSGKHFGPLITFEFLISEKWLSFKNTILHKPSETPTRSKKSIYKSTSLEDVSHDSSKSLLQRFSHIRRSLKSRQNSNRKYKSESNLVHMETLKVDRFSLLPSILFILNVFLRCYFVFLGSDDCHFKQNRVY